MFVALVAEGKTRQELQTILGKKRSAIQQYASKHKIKLGKIKRQENIWFPEYVLIDGIRVDFSPCDRDWLEKYRWRIDTYGYARTYCPERKQDIRMHQLIIRDMNCGNYIEAVKNIHHKDYNKCNNRRENLHVFANPKQHWYFEKYVCTHPNNPRFGFKHQKEALPF